MDTLRIIDPASGQSTPMSFGDLRTWMSSFPTTNIDRDHPAALALHVDTNWYMTEGPGTYFNPARFSGVSDVLRLTPNEAGISLGESRSLASFFSAPDASPLKASISHYRTDVESASYEERMSVWGGTSALIEGTIANINGRLVLTNYKIAPYNDNFNFFDDPTNFVKDQFNKFMRSITENSQYGVPLKFYKDELSNVQRSYSLDDLSRDAKYNKSIDGPFSAGAVLNALKRIGTGFQLQRCFLRGTKVRMADASLCNIQDIAPGDQVASFNPNQDFSSNIKLQQGKVNRVFKNISHSIIDLRGLHCTTGHFFLRGDKKGCFASIASILREDQSIVDENGVAIRARTGAKLFTEDDLLVQVVYYDNFIANTPNTRRRALVRAGIPLPATILNDGRSSTNSATLAQHLEIAEVVVLSDSSLRAPDGTYHLACTWPEGSTPFDTHEARNWIVEADGQPYTPPWIRDLVEEDEHQGLRVVGAMPTLAAPP